MYAAGSVRVTGRAGVTIGTLRGYTASPPLEEVAHMAEQTAARSRRAHVLPPPGISDDVLRAVDVLEDQLERLLGPRVVPPPPVIRNVNDLAAEQMTLGARVADAFAS